MHHGIKDPEQAVALLDQAYQQCVGLLDRVFAPWEPEIVLPPGMPDLLALPVEDDQDG